MLCSRTRARHLCGASQQPPLLVMCLQVSLGQRKQYDVTCVMSNCYGARVALSYRVVCVTMTTMMMMMSKLRLRESDTHTATQ